jgi:hypothetical protein
MLKPLIHLVKAADGSTNIGPSPKYTAKIRVQRPFHSVRLRVEIKPKWMDSLYIITTPSSIALL